MTSGGALFPLAGLLALAAAYALGGCGGRAERRVVRVELSESAPLRLSPDGSMAAVASGSSYAIVSLAGADKPAVSMSSTTHRGEIHDLAFSPDGAHFAIVGFRRLEVTGGHGPHGGGGVKKEIKPPGITWSADFSPDGKLLATSQGVYEVGSWELAFRLAPPPLEAPFEFAPVRPAERADAGAAQEDAGSLGDAGVGDAGDASADAGARTQSAPLAGPSYPLRSPEHALAVRFSEDGKRLFVLGVSGALVLETGSWKTLSTAPPPTQMSSPGSIALSRQGKVVWCRGCVDVPVYSLGGDALAHEATLRHGASVEAAALSSDGALVALASRQKLAVYDAKSGDERISFELDPDESPAIRSLAFRPDGKLVGFRGDDSIALYDLPRIAR